MFHVQEGWNNLIIGRAWSCTAEKLGVDKAQGRNFSVSQLLVLPFSITKLAHCPPGNNQQIFG